MCVRVCEREILSVSVGERERKREREKKKEQTVSPTTLETNWKVSDYRLKYHRPNNLCSKSHK